MFNSIHLKVLDELLLISTIAVGVEIAEFVTGSSLAMLNEVGKAPIHGFGIFIVGNKDLSH